MNKKELEKRNYNVYKEDEKYYYAKDKDGYLYNFNKKSKNINLKEICFYNIFSIYNIKKYIQNNNLNVELISTSFINTNNKLEFKDKNGHTFFQDWHHFTRKGSSHLCKKCVNEKVRQE